MGTVSIQHVRCVWYKLKKLCRVRVQLLRRVASSVQFKALRGGTVASTGSSGPGGLEGLVGLDRLGSLETHRLDAFQPS